MQLLARISSWPTGSSRIFTHPPPLPPNATASNSHLRKFKQVSPGSLFYKYVKLDMAYSEHLAGTTFFCDKECKSLDGRIAIALPQKMPSEVNKAARFPLKQGNSFTFSTQPNALESTAHSDSIFNGMLSQLVYTAMQFPGKGNMAKANLEALSAYAAGGENLFQLGNPCGQQLFVFRFKFSRANHAPGYSGHLLLSMEKGANEGAIQAANHLYNQNPRPAAYAVFINFREY